MTMNQIEPDSDFAEDIRNLFVKLAVSQREWQDAIGFGEEGHRLRKEVEERRAVLADVQGVSDQGVKDSAASALQRAEDALRNYYIAKLALIDTEVAEAIEELRNGHSMTEAYYPRETYLASMPEHERATYPDAHGPFKPEGVPSEIADIVIRCFSLAGEIGLDLGSVVVEKLNFNATRAQKHGGKAI